MDTLLTPQSTQNTPPPAFTPPSGAPQHPHHPMDAEPEPKPSDPLPSMQKPAASEKPKEEKTKTEKQKSGKPFSFSILKPFISIILALSLMFFLIFKSDVIQKQIDPIDAYTQKELTNQMMKAGGVYLTARGLSGLLSIITSSSVSASPLGVGVDVGIGQILSPVKEILDRFSSIMLLATGSIALQKLILLIGIGVFLKLLLPIALALFVISNLLKKKPHQVVITSALKIFVFALVFRFFIPLSCLVGSQIDSFFLNPTYEQSKVEMEEISNDASLKAITTPKTAAKSGISGTLAALKVRIEKLSDTLAHLIAVFIIQTILLPLFVLWGMKKIFNSFSLK